MIVEYKKPAQKEYKQRHDIITRIVCLKLCQKFGLVGEVKWYNHKPASVVENDRVKILWDFNIQTDHVIQHRGPDIVALYKNWKKVSPYWYCCTCRKKYLVERTGKNRQLQQSKTGIEKDLELVSSCGCSSCNCIPRSDIEKIERLAEEVRCQEWYRTFAKSSIAWICKNYKARPRDLALLGATCSLGNLPKLPTKPK